MNQLLQKKIALYKEAAKSRKNTSVTNQPDATRTDGLAKVIRSKKDADTFMAELDDIIKRAK